jgi:phosphatidate cytidylyltransferase
MNLGINNKNLFFRVLSGVVLVPVVVFSFILYPTLIGLVTTIVMLASWEFIEISSLELKNKKIFKMMLTVVVGASALLYGFAIEAEYQGILPFEAEIVFYLAFFFYSWLVILKIKDVRMAKKLISAGAISILYISFFLSNFYLININYGYTMGILALVSVFMYDSFAYFAGLSFGKHKISPNFSPKKSWEGLIGGALGTYLFIIVYEFIRGFLGYENIIGPKKAILFALMVASFDTVGDLTESIFKRHYHVKDSSSILPGHGGILDRIDGILIVTPAWYFLLRIFWI